MRNSFIIEVLVIVIFFTQAIDVIYWSQRDRYETQQLIVKTCGARP